MLPDRFGGLTVGEILNWLDAAFERQRLLLRSQARQAWQIGVACYYAIGAALSSENSYPSFLEMFPIEKTQEEVAAEEEIAWQIQKADFKAAMNASA